MERSIGDRAANGDSCAPIAANSRAADSSQGKGFEDLSPDLKVARFAAFFNGAGIYSAADLEALSARAGLPGRTAWTWRELDFLLRVRIEQRFGPRRIPWWDQPLTETGKEVLGECW